MTVAIVAGALANKPGNGGAAWTRLSWILGLRELGFAVHFVEQVTDDLTGIPWACTILTGFDVPATFVGADGTVVHRLGDGCNPAGARARDGGPDLAERIADAALLVNLSGNLAVACLRDRAAVRIYVDLDPGYTQLWHAQGLLDLAGHTHYRTVGLRVGTPGCALPIGGLAWRPVRQPVLLDQWPTAPAAPPRFTTVTSWRGPYGSVQHAGRILGPKAHQFRRFLPLPQHAPGTFELAVTIDPADAKDRAALDEHGWRLADPAAVAGDPQAFRGYVQASGAECSVAQGMYVETAAGWFSDRTTRYLASGRPALVQDTGFRETLPTGEGLVTFTTLEGAVRGAQRILADEAHHTAAARQLAEEHFAAEVVLGRLCEEVDVAP